MRVLQITMLLAATAAAASSSAAPVPAPAPTPELKDVVELIKGSRREQGVKESKVKAKNMQ